MREGKGRAVPPLTEGLEAEREQPAEGEQFDERLWKHQNSKRSLEIAGLAAYYYIV